MAKRNVKGADRYLVKHYKGGEYEILGIGLMESGLDAMVLYTPKEGGIIWIRPVKEFFRKIQIDGKMIKRFERIQ